MPRMSRQRSESGYYHVMIRGNNKKDIFKKDEEKERFFEIIKKNKSENKWRLRAYCIMNNHAHLLIEECEYEINQIMKKINVSYAMYYNKKYKITGHVFQDRYKSEVVADDTYLLVLMRYIHQNPIKAGMVKNIKDYKWSSYNEYIGKATEKITDIDIIEIFSKNKKEAIEGFKAFHKENDDNTYLEDKEETLKKKKKRAWKMIEDRLNKSAASKKELAELLLKNTKLPQRRIAEMLEINRGAVQRIGSKLKDQE
ncbi:MAG: transposase [Clostridia bacterium]|nr:transposase [Clostridia bacterium]